MSTTTDPWETYKTFRQSISKNSFHLFRKEAVAFIMKDHPTLEELGTSDINCYAVTMIETGLLVPRLNGWEWKHRGWLGVEHEPRCTCGRLRMFCTTRGDAESTIPHNDDYEPERVP